MNFTPTDNVTEVSHESDTSPTDAGGTGQPQQFPPEKESGAALPPKTLAQKLQERCFRSDKKPAEVQPVFCLKGKPICTRGNLTTLLALAKTGKTSLAGAFIAATFAVQGADTLGITSSNPLSKAVLHFDTEQSPLDHWTQMMTSLRRAGVAKEPEWLRSYCLTGMGLGELLQFVTDAIGEARREFGGIHSIHIDGWADFVSNVNDPEESNKLVAKVQKIALACDCPIIGVIHLNPDGAKTRGHLGSQLERKSESNLRLDKDNKGVTTVWGDKQRHAPILKADGMQFKWDEAAQMHKSVEVSVFDIMATVEFNAEAKSLRDRVFDGANALRHDDLVLRVQNVTGMSESTGKRILTEWVQDNIVRKNDLGAYEPAA